MHKDPFVERDCGSIPETDINGYVEFDMNSVETLFGQTLTYFCDEGYLPAVQNITCDETGQWSRQHNCTGKCNLMCLTRMIYFLKYPHSQI